MDFIEGAKDQFVFAIDALKAHRRITGQSRGHRAVGLIPLIAQRPEDGFWIRTVAEGATNDQPRCFPFGPG